MLSPLTTRISHRVGDSGCTQIPDSWIIQPHQEVVCKLSSSVQLKISPFSFADSSGGVVQKPIQLKMRWLVQLADFVGTGRSGYHAQGIFSSLVQFEIRAFRTQVPLQLIKPLVLEWETHTEQTVNGMQLAVGTSANWQALFNTNSPSQWSLQHNGSFQYERSNNDRLLFRLSLPRLGWWSLGFLHFCEYESRILRIIPVPALAPLEHARAIWLLPNWNTYLEIPASPRGFATFQVPRIKQGTIQISASHQGTWWWAEESVPLSSNKIHWQPQVPLEG